MSPLLLIVPGGVLWWVFLLNVLALTNGWRALARHYRAGTPFAGTRFRMCSAKLGRSNYGSLLTVGVNADGLYLSVAFLFRPGHPPLFIPWPEVDATFAKGWLFHYLDLRFAQVPHLRLRVQKSLGLKIAAAANRSWDAGDPPADGAA